MQKMSQKKGNPNDCTNAPAENIESFHSMEKPSGSLFSKRKITCNWSRYDELPPEEPEEHIDQYDYGYLSKNYSSDNNYFQLSSEKEWTKQAAIPNSSLFALNLKNLSAGLGCIPFYDRIDVDKTLLLDCSIANCDAEAKANLLKYKPELDNLRAKQNKQKDIVKINPLEETNVASALDNSLHIASPDMDLATASKTDAVKSPQDDELEDWLDSVLDD